MTLPKETGYKLEKTVREDIILLQKCIAGDRDSFRGIVERYQSLICSIAYSATGDLALSEDIAI